MDSCVCPITGEVFEDPVVGDDGHTYERKAITEWLQRSGTSPMTQQPMNINSLRTNYTVKKMMEELKIISQGSQSQCEYRLDIDIRKTKTRPLFQGFGKFIYEVEWINRKGPPIILLKIDGAKAKREASFYVKLSCHPHVVRTFGFVQSNPNSVMLLQECAPHGDLCELLRENGFKPTERVLWRIFEQICDAMVCLADNGIVHGDLACRNVLVFEYNHSKPEENLVKLTDFGLTRGSSLYSIVGAPTSSVISMVPTRYTAPEVLQNVSQPTLSVQSDVYSMGIFMWEACSYGEIPYSSIDDENEVRRIKLRGTKLSRPSRCNDQLWTLMNECWQQSPEDRPNFQRLKRFLSSLDVAKRVNTDRLNKLTSSSRTLEAHSISTTYDSFHQPTLTTPSDRRQSIFARDCGEECTNDIALQQHQQTNCRNRSVECSFCEQTFPTSNALREQLTLCGNKTDECPKCRQFIRRSHFAYHYQNNCALVSSIETPPNQRRLQIAQRSPVNPNLPVLEEDSSTDDDYAERNRKVHSAESNRKHIQLIVRCEYCQQPCAQNDYERHKNNCLRRPANQNRSPSNDIVHIPCEICHAPIDLPNWSNHVQSCRERENERIKNRARSINAEPVNEGLPCEYCDRLFSARQLQSHQRACQRNPNNMKGQAQNERPRQGVVLPVQCTPSNDQRARPSPRPPYGEAPYEKIDHEQTRIANGLSNDRQVNQRAHDNTPLLHRSRSTDSAPDENVQRRSRSRDRSEKTPTKAEGRVLPKNQKADRRSSMEKLRNFELNDDRLVPVGDNRSLSMKSQRTEHSIERKNRSYEVINNDEHTPSTKKNKKLSSSCTYFCSGPVNEPIPAHPDSIYRPQNRPLPVFPSPPARIAMAPSPMVDSVPVAAPLGSNGNGFSPWWIIGPLLAVLAVMTVGALAYLKKKQNDSENKDTNNEENRDGNISLEDIKSNGFPNAQKKTISALSAKKGMTLYLIKIYPETRHCEDSYRKSLRFSREIGLSHSENLIPSSPNTIASSKTSTIADENQPNLDKHFKSSEAKPYVTNPTSIGRSPTKELTSPGQHGIGKSPFVSTIPTGSKATLKENTSSQLHEKLQNRSTSKISSTEPQTDVLSNQDAKKSSKDSETKNIPMPHVPQCKTNTSSSDDDDNYDELYPIESVTSKPSKIDKTSTNRNSSILRPKRLNFKRIHHRENKFTSTNTQEH
ncbi:unnamed protein product [Adineta ricciae]|uniref:Uncharacterized protein n=1 Tax=Adineta ricciae TaxID=249248 RepID=A0A814ZGC5_ADIRI|nr:unnamed protein product [Adineta ricciae]